MVDTLRYYARAYERMTATNAVAVPDRTAPAQQPPAHKPDPGSLRTADA